MNYYEYCKMVMKAYGYKKFNYLPSSERRAICRHIERAEAEKLNTIPNDIRMTMPVDTVQQGLRMHSNTDWSYIDTSNAPSNASTSDTAMMDVVEFSKKNSLEIQYN